MEKKIMLLVEFIFYIVTYWGRLMAFIFTCVWGCRKPKITFLHLILSKTLSHWRCTFNIVRWLIHTFLLTLSWRRPLSYRNQSIDLQSKSMDWFLYDNGLRHERVNKVALHCSIIKIWFKIFNISITHFAFKREIKKWVLNKCLCRICKNYLPNIGLI